MGLRLYRIADTRHSIWDGTGAFLMGGRFNGPGKPLIYAAHSYSCAMLEVLAHTNIGSIPPTQAYVEASVPDELAVETRTADDLPDGWDGKDLRVARAFGDRWLNEARTVILFVPSVVARVDFNALVNPLHPDAAKITVSAPRPVLWDQRLFER